MSGNLTITGNTILTTTTATTLTTSGLITGANGLTISSGVVSLPAGSISNTELANSTVSYGGVTLALGEANATPAFNLISATGLPISTGVAGLATGISTFLSTATSNNLANSLTDETGTGFVVFSDSPTLSGTLNAQNAIITGNINLGDTTADTIAINATIEGASPLIFEGLTANLFQTTIAVTDPTVDRTITLPNLSGEVSLLGQTITGGEIVDGTVSNADLANYALTVTAGTGLTGGGVVALGGSTTLTLNTTGDWIGTLDGIEGASFLRSDVADTATGALTFSAGLTMSGSASNIALGSNFLSGDGGDEGVYVDASGNVGIGTTTPSRRLSILDTSSNPQVRFSFDASNFAELAVGAAGDLTISASGGDVSLLNENLRLCSGGACPIDSNTLAGKGNIVAEGRVFASGFEPLSCPTGMIPVPASPQNGLQGFCIDKYEAKNVGGIATSQAAGTPWINITQYNARAQCIRAGKHLVTEKQ